MKNIPTLAFFMERVNVSESGCWVWARRTDRDGYGLLCVKRKGVRTTWKAHRLSVLLYTGNLDESLNVCHHCDNPPCVNPAHLYQGTTAQNVADKVSRGRHKFPIMPGALNPNTKLTEHDVLTIRASTLPVRELADIYNVSSNHVARIQKGLAWKCLNGEVVA